MPGLTIRLPTDGLALLRAACAVRNASSGAVIGEALLAWLGTLPASDRKLIAELAKRKEAALRDS